MTGGVGRVPPPELYITKLVKMSAGAWVVSPPLMIKKNFVLLVSTVTPPPYLTQWGESSPSPTLGWG